MVGGCDWGMLFVVIGNFYLCGSGVDIFWNVD
jgi:hypothetical protein